MSLVLVASILVGVSLLSALLLTVLYRYIRYSLCVPTAPRSVLIIGCDSGLGYATALRLAALGHNVIATCLSQTQADQLKSASNNTITTVILDLLDTDTTADTLRRIISKRFNDRLDCVINNAGVFSSFLVELTSLSTYRRSLDINVLGVVNVVQTVLPYLKRGECGDSRIVTIGSFLGGVSLFGTSAYTMSKYALEALHDSLRCEMRRLNISVALIKPGTMQTPMIVNVVRQQHAMIEAAPAEVRDDYGGVAGLQDTVQHVDLMMGILSSPLSPVVDAVIHASVRGRYPLSRYYVGFDSYFFTLIGMMPLAPYISDWAQIITGCLHAPMDKTSKK